MGVSAAWLCGLGLAGSVAVGAAGAWLALGALLAGMAGVVLGSGSKRAHRSLASARLLLIGAALCSGMATPASEDPSVRPPAGLARFEAVVLASSARQQDDARSVLRVERGERVEDGAELPRGALIEVAPVPLPEGARVRVLARVSPYAPFRNPSPHPSVPARFALVGRARIEGTGGVRVLEHAWSSALLWRARCAVREALEATLRPRSAALARALVLGDDGALDDATLAAVRDSGLLHVLAVSGLHVAILAGLLVAAIHALLLRTPLARRLEVRRLACALGVPLALSYAAFAGGAPSAWRAAITAAIAWTLSAVGRRPGALATTCAAALLLGAADPVQALRPAFLLSVAATVAIVGDEPVAGTAGSRTLVEWAAAAMRTSLRATLATSPIVLACFGSLPLIGLLANVVLLPFGTLLLVQLSALHAAVATLTPFGALTAPVFATSSEAFLAATSALGRLAPALAVPPLDRWQVAALAAASAMLLTSRAARTRAIVCGALVLLLAVLELRLRHEQAPHDQLRVTFLDVGQGDAALVDLPDGRAMLIDSGGNPAGGADPGERVLLPLLAARRRARIDIAVLTHPHPDHYGGLRAIIPHLPIVELWDSGQAEAERGLGGGAEEASHLLDAARARGTRVLGPPQLCGRPRRAGAARIEVLWPCPSHDPGYDANDNSLVLRVSFGARSVLFAGDAEAHAEQALLALGTLARSEVLKVGHHGSRTSSSSAFLAAVAPELAIVSAGASNRFGHPHPEVLARLRSHRATPIVLSDDGGTVVATDGRNWRVHTWNGRNLLLPSRSSTRAAEMSL